MMLASTIVICIGLGLGNRFGMLGSFAKGRTTPVPAPGGFELREDGSTELREDGTKELRE